MAETNETAPTRWEWSAKTAGPGIAIVTTDAVLDARIRDAFRDKEYSLITVPLFSLHEKSLRDTSFAIIDMRNPDIVSDAPNISWLFTWMYPVFGIFTRAHVEMRLLKPCFAPYSEKIPDDFDPTELYRSVKFIIDFNRTYEPDESDAAFQI